MNRIDEQQGQQDEGPCSHASHAQARKSREAFEARTKAPRYEWLGAIYAQCARGCGSTIAIELEETT